MPPRRAILDGSPSLSEFTRIGSAVVKLLQERGLKPEHRFLDVGSGTGRVAIPLTRYLMGSQSYEGFDPVRRGVEWCSQNITTRFPNFQFKAVDVYNSCYNPKGRCAARDFCFPYDSAHFDFTFLGSVFTHMVPADLEHYLSEISRVLKPGGKCIISYYLLNQTSLQGVTQGKSNPPFPYAGEELVCRITRKDIPEAAVAYDEAFIAGLYSKYGLEIERPLLYGDWSYSGQQNQDIVVAAKPR